MNRTVQLFYRFNFILSLTITTLVSTSFQSKSQSIELPSFKTIRCSGNIQVRYQAGMSSTLTFHNLSEQKVRYYVDKEQLVIKSTTFDRKQPRVIITLTGAPVESVRVQKNAIVILDSLTVADSCSFVSLTAGEITAQINNSALGIKSDTGGLIHISGATKALWLRSTGGSKVSARDLLFKEAKLKITTGAFVDLKHEGKITGKISSGGELRIIGQIKPEKVTTSSGGKIILSDD